MNYYLSERGIPGERRRTAWSKAREDADAICASEGFHALCLRPESDDRAAGNLAAKLRGHWDEKKQLAELFCPLAAGDALFLQLPLVNNCLFLAGLLRSLRRGGVRVIALVHDLELLRMSLVDNIRLRSRLRMRAEESSVLAQCDRIIVHNDRMRTFLAERGIPAERMVPLGLFDYLMAEDTARAVAARLPSSDRESLVIAGNLSPEKAGYVYDLPTEGMFELYGVGFAASGGTNVRYHGSYRPEELPAVLSGGFGLVWDGPSAKTCAGPYGEYLRYNDPHKTSLYLASGFPVVIWDQAALAELVVREGVGLTAASIAEAVDKVRRLTDEEYRACAAATRNFGRKLRQGGFLREALRRSLDDR